MVRGGSVIDVYNIPEADQSLYNFKQKGSYVAHGALLTNLEISSQERGFSAQVSIFPDPSDDDLVAKFFLRKAEDQTRSDLYPFIFKRCTNRKDYDGSKLSDDVKRQLLGAAKSAGAVFKLIDDDLSLATLAKHLAVNELMLFQNRKLHDFFYSHIIWKEEEQSKAGGFYIKTLEFTKKQLGGVKLFRSWHALKIFNKLAGVAKMIARENGEKYARSGTLGAIVVSGNDKKDFVHGGRVAQRVWLTATKIGLSIHPCTGTLFLGERIAGGDTNSFSIGQQKEITEAHSKIKKIFGADSLSIPMLFRIGRGEPPTARSMRLMPKIEVK